MPRPKGLPKTGGRKKRAEASKSSPSKDFRSRLEGEKVNLEKELRKAIDRKDVDMIRALAALLPYLTPRLKEPDNESDPDAPPPTPEALPPPPTTENSKPDFAGVNNDKLLRLLKKTNGT